jgi:hypothetical protein
MQLTIANYIKEIIDPIEITSITKELVDNYDVICIDHYAINENWNNMDLIKKYLDIIKNCKAVCLLTRDLHQWTFSNDRHVITNFTNTNYENYQEKLVYDGYYKLKSLLKDYNIGHIISIYDCEELYSLIKYSECNYSILSLHIDTNIYRNLNVTRDIDILIYGADFHKVYPLRNKIKNAVKKMNIKYHIIPTFVGYDPEKCDEGLAKLLNRSWLTLCTCSVFDYLVLKYFEASACGSVIIGNMSSQGREIWQDNYIDVPLRSTSKEIKKIIRRALQNKGKLINISNVMSEKITNEYNYEKYTTKLKNICEKVSNTNNI